MKEKFYCCAPGLQSIIEQTTCHIVAMVLKIFYYIEIIKKIFCKVNMPEMRGKKKLKNIVQFPG